MALGIQIMGSRTLLGQLAALRATVEPTDNGHSRDPTDDSGSLSHISEELPTICTAEPRNRERSR